MANWGGSDEEIDLDNHDDDDDEGSDGEWMMTETTIGG